jgi:hypothetical protein
MDNEVTEHISTRIISQREVNVDGVPFSWWAVAERPALVTVRTPIFGALSDFTNGDVAVFAETLARKLLADHQARNPHLRKPADVPALQKPGWFEPGSTDYTATTTIF